MQRFPPEILLNIFQHLTLYSQRQCLKVSRLWRAVAFTFTTDNTRKIELDGLEDIKRFAEELSSNHERGLNIRQMRISLEPSIQDYQTQNEVAAIAKGCPNLAEIITNSLSIMQNLYDMKIRLEYLETFHSTDRRPLGYGKENYIDAMYHHRETLHSLHIQHYAPSFHPRIALTDHLHQFKCLKYLSFEYPTAMIVFDEVLRACPQLQALKLRMLDDGAFHVLRGATGQHADTLPDTIPSSQLETLSISYKLITQQLYRYLYHHCRHLSHLEVLQGYQGDSLSRVFAAFDRYKPLPITKFSFYWCKSAPDGLLQNLGYWFPRLCVVEISAYDLKSVVDFHLNAALDFGRLNIVHLSLNFSSIFDIPANGMPIVLKIITGDASLWYQQETLCTFWYQKKRLGDRNEYFQLKRNSEGRAQEDEAVVITIKALNIHRIQFHAQREPFDQLIDLRD